MNNLFAERLKWLREKEDLLQRELAEELNLSRVTITHYEQGKRSPEWGTLQKIADFFNVSTDYLLGRTDDPTPPDADEPTDQELEELMRKGGLMFDGIPMDEEDREDILAAMRIAWQMIQKRKP